MLRSNILALQDQLALRGLSSKTVSKGYVHKISRFQKAYVLLPCHIGTSITFGWVHGLEGDTANGRMGLNCKLWVISVYVTYW